MTVVRNGAEGQTSGTTISTTNSDDFGDTAFSAVTLGGGTAKYDNTFPGDGTMGFKFTPTVSADFVNLDFPTSTANAAVEFDYYHDGNPSATLRLATLITSGSTGACGIAITTAGKIFISSTAGAQIAITTAALTTNTQYRIALQASIGGTATTGTVSLSYYSGAQSTTAVETIGSSGAANIGTANMTTARFGSCTNVTIGKSVYLDSLQVADSASVIGPYPGGSPTPTLTSGVAAGVGTTTAKVRIDGANATSAIVTAATNTGLTTGVVTSSSVTLDSDGLGIASLTGLSAATDYFFGVAFNGGSPTADRGNFRTATAGAHNFSFAAASCLANSGNPTVLDAIRTRTGPSGRTAEFFAQLGDIHYRSRTSPSTATLLADYRTVLATSKPLALMAAIPTEYTWSDHDIGPDNCDSVSLGSTTIANLRNVWSRYFATYDLPAVNTDTTPYRSWVHGRVRFVMTDGRTYMSDIAATDNSSKTKLGVTQKQWLKDEWTAAKAAGQAIVWFHEDGGFNQTTTFAGNDSWSAYTTERAELATFITANGLASRILLIHGDWHNLAADDGTNTSGGIPVACVGPLQQTYVLPSNPTWTQGHYPTTDPGGNFQQYGWFDVTDSGGSTLSIAFTGYSNDDTGGTGSDTSRITMTRTLDTSFGVSGTVAGTSSTAGTVTAQLQATGTTAGTSATSGTLTARYAATGSTAGVSATTGALTARLVIAGTAAAAVSSTTGNVTVVSGPVTYQAAGTVTVVSGTSGNITIAAPITAAGPDYTVTAAVIDHTVTAQLIDHAVTAPTINHTVEA